MKRVRFCIVIAMFLISIIVDPGFGKATFQGYWEQTTQSNSTIGGQPQNRSEQQTVYFKSGMMKIVNATKGEEIIFRLDLGLIWTINTKTKTYTEAKFSDMEENMKNARNAMAENMKNMTIEQRQMMEKMMGGQLGSMMGNEGGPSITFKMLSETKTINGHNCKKVIMMMNNEPMVTMWMTDKYDLGDDFVEAYQKMGLFKGTFSEDVKNLKGFPMQTEMSMDTGFGTVSTNTVVTKIVEKSLANSDFNLPAGLTKQTMPQMNFH
ncbi:hypothetical protein JW960_07625 [candidate division KSB1 bacterium]|nr:hypothetical protein [candidate division KSB1 bacterium]